MTKKEEQLREFQIEIRILEDTRKMLDKSDWATRCKIRERLSYLRWAVYNKEV